MIHGYKGKQLLLINNALGVRPIITVALTTKWYTLYLVDPSGAISEFEPDAGEVGYRDNTYNPQELADYAEKHNFDIDPLAFEMIVGRWEIETKENY